MIGNRLQELYNKMIQKGLVINKRDFSEKLNIKYGNLSKYLTSQVNLSIDNNNFTNFEKMGVNIKWLLTGEGEMFTDTKEEPVRHPIKTIVESIEGLLIPYLDQPVSAGFGQELLNEEDNDRYICIPDTGGKKDLKALTVKGDSMEPTLKNGDIVVCDTGGWDGDGVYVIKTHEFAFVKRVVLQTEGYQVISDNKMYPPYQVPVSEDTVIVGKVYCAVVKM